ncbi:MAG: hypothetical protein NXI30_05915 [bacterium]|nr:hypothetical protein [bacterium]
MRIDVDLARVERAGISALISSLTDYPSDGDLCSALVDVLERRDRSITSFELDLEGASERDMKAIYFAVERAEASLIETPGNVWAIYLCKLLQLEIAAVGIERFAS